MSAGLDIARVESLAGVDALASEWTALERATPEATGFQSFGWCRAWIAVAPPAQRPCILCVREAGRLVMLLPLQIERRFGVTIARWLGEPMTQYGDALALPGADRAAWRKAAEAEMASWRDVDLFALTRLRAGGVFAEGATEGERLSAPFVDLRAPLRRHKSVERRAKRLANGGEIALVEAQTAAERVAFARRALALKRDWLRGKGFFSAGLSNPATEVFLVHLAESGFLRLHALMVGAAPVAFDIGFAGGGAYRSLLGCYDARFSEGSPGQVLTARLLAGFAQEGLAAYDMLLPADAYKLAWATGETEVGARFIVRNVKGRLAAFALARLRPLAKRMARALGGGLARMRARAFSSSSAGASLPASQREETA